MYTLPRDNRVPYCWQVTLSPTVLPCPFSPEKFLPLSVLTPCVLVVLPGLVIYMLLLTRSVWRPYHMHITGSLTTQARLGKMGIMLSIQIGHPTIMTTDTNTEASNFLLSLLLLATPILYKPDSLDTAMSHRCFENCQSQLWPQIKWDPLWLTSAINHMEPQSFESCLRNAQR